MIDDEKIIEMFFERSEQGIRELDIKYGKVCHNLSYHIVGSRRDAEECVNDAYLGAWNAIPPAKPTPAEYGTGHDDIETSNGTITLEYITELQAKVSTAMSNGELPFVSSSAVYENPYRLHIIVTSNAETDLSKLKAFDTIGGALEIEYDANHISAVEEILTE